MVTVKYRLCNATCDVNTHFYDLFFRTKCCKIACCNAPSLLLKGICLNCIQRLISHAQ